MKIKDHNVFPTKIKDKKEFLDAVNDFGLNFCKGSVSLKRDIDCVLSAIKNDPFSIVYVPQEVITNPEIQTVIKNRNKYLEKYGKHVASPFLYTSLAAAYCDVSDFDNAKKYADKAYSYGRTENHSDLIAVYQRIKKENTRVSYTKRRKL